VKLVKHCPCGEEHEISDDVFAKLVDPAASKTPALAIMVPDFGTWLVPRVFLACHYQGLDALKLAELAFQYGFERAPRQILGSEEDGQS